MQNGLKSALSLRDRERNTAKDKHRELNEEYNAYDDATVRWNRFFSLNLYSIAVLFCDTSLLVCLFGALS